MPNPGDSGKLCIGLISGTSMDGIDAALVEFGERRCRVLASLACDYPPALRADLLAASRDPERCSLDRLGDLDQRVGECFRDAAMALLAQSDCRAADVTAIGSHGQTIRHRPDAPKPYTLQIGDPNLIAAGTGITTVADFRRMDMAAGGQGAPLAPAFHHWLFAEGNTSPVVLNIGGIANLTILDAKPKRVTGFDTGPGNTLMDGWARRHLNSAYDTSGEWAARGKVRIPLLESMLADPYFTLAPPKSTGFEYFNDRWLEAHVGESCHDENDAADVQATLSELTAASIAEVIGRYAADARELLVCGGGVHNDELMRRLRARLPALEVVSTADRGLDPDWVEAAAFAWLAGRRLDAESGNLAGVTGARREVVLGGVYKG